MPRVKDKIKLDESMSVYDMGSFVVDTEGARDFENPRECIFVGRPNVRNEKNTKDSSGIVRGMGQTEAVLHDADEILRHWQSILG